jgi:hypothetical protein
MTTKVQALTIIALGATLVIASGQTAQTTATAPAAAAPPALSPTEQTIKDIKNPVSWMTWGGDLRLRNEYFNNAQSLGPTAVDSRFGPYHSQDYFRYRARVWTTITPVEDLSLNARLAAEPRQWMEPSSSGTFSRQEGMEWRYGIVDNLNVQWKKPLDLPATLTIGRQDIFPGTPSGLGDGWLVADGTPGDGSWTFFVDAARLTYQLEDLHTTIDAIGLVQYAQPDAWLPTIGSSTTAGSPSRYTLTDQNEKGAILSIANKSIPVANMDGYFIYKQDTRVTTPPPGATSSANGLGTYANGDNANIYTVGGRVSGPLDDHWKYSAEGAYQFGRKQDPNLKHSDAGAAAAANYHDLNAFGVNSRLSYLFKDELKNQVFLAFEFLSGDNPATADDEMFDVLWGRWPRWSELYNIYSYIPETRVGQTANVWRLGPGWSFSPTKKMDCSLNYNVLFANQDVPTRQNIAPNPVTGLTPFTDTGNFRGQYLQAILRYKFSAHMSGHLWSEFVFPGDFYQSTQVMTFLRAELLFTL